MENYKHIHFIGIGGVSMSSLAEIMHDRGYVVTGSDHSQTATTDHLKEIGIRVDSDHLSKNVEGADLVVYTAAIAQENIELVSAREKGIPTMERALFMGELLKGYRNRIGVCGAHGKTTTTSMLTAVYMLADKNPTSLIGAMYPAINANFLSGGKNTCIFESCEYVNSFLNFPTDVAVVLNIDEDHLDFFKNLDNIKKSFFQYISGAKTVITNEDCPNSRDVVKKYRGRKIRFSQIDEDVEYFGKIVNNQKYPKFACYENGNLLGEIQLRVPGVHNVSNALAAIACARLDGISFEVITRALQDFGGASRRFDMQGYYPFLLVDDYAHHPAEMVASLQAAKKLAKGKVICVFQPHTYSRPHALFNDFVDALSLCDKAILVDIYSAREIDTGVVSSKMLADAIPGGLYAESFEKAKDMVISLAQKDDIVLTMGAGDVFKVGDLIKNELG